MRVETRRLTREAAESLCAKHHVGSLAIGFHDALTIELVNYVYSEGSIYGRLEDGPDLTVLKHHQWVAFQMSEVEGVYDWRTVTVRGSVQLLIAERSEHDRAECEKALALLRSVVPAVMTDRDPIPQRVQLFRLFIDSIEGRESRSESARGLPPA